MKQKTIFTTLFLSVVGILLLIMWTDDVDRPDPNDMPAVTVKKASTSKIYTNNLRTERDAHLAGKMSAPITYPVMTPAQTKHVAIKRFLRTQCRDSSVARTMIKRLREEGYGIEALASVYTAAYAIKRMDPALHCVTVNCVPLYEDTPDSIHRRNYLRGYLIHTLTRGDPKSYVPAISESLAAELIDLRPLVTYQTPEPYSREMIRDLNDPVLLTDADLDAYMAANPINEPENDRGRYMTEEDYKHMEEARRINMGDSRLGAVRE
jgi:hypothetical protein